LGTPAQNSCATLSTFDCADFATEGNVNQSYRVYVVVADVDATKGIAGVQFGIEYDAYDYQSYTGGIYIQSWTNCADIAWTVGTAHLTPAVISPGEGRMFEQLSTGELPQWPLSGSSGVFTWRWDTNCQVSEPAGPGTGAAAVVGYFTLTAYDYGAWQGGSFSVIPRPADGRALVADCSAVATRISKLGRVGFANEVGFNPCAVPILDSLFTSPVACSTSAAACGIRFAWADLPDETGYVVFRDGEILATLPADSTEVVDFPPRGVPHTYGVAALGQEEISPQCLSKGPWVVSVPDQPGNGGLSLLAERNPFVAPVGLAFRLPASGDVVLRIYSVSGRLVRAFEPEMHPAGAGRMVWDGRDDRGDAVRPGIYFARLASVGLSATQRLVLLR
jgi:hypothetical protein